jgi:hypothetical protein
MDIQLHLRLATGVIALVGAAIGGPVCGGAILVCYVAQNVALSV